MLSNNLNMMDAFDGVTVDAILKVVTIESVDFVKNETTVETPIKAVITTAKPERVNPEIYDWSKKYIQVTSQSKLEKNNIVNYQGTDYCLITSSNFNDYGFFKAVGEEIK